MESGETSEIRHKDGTDEQVWSLLEATPGACVNVALHHLYDPDEIDLVISGPNYGRNASSSSTLSSGTVGAALDGALLGKKSIALSFSFIDREVAFLPESISNASETACNILQSLWENWPSLSTHSHHGIPDLYNVNVPLRREPNPPIHFTTFHPGSYGPVYQSVEETESSGGGRRFVFKPKLPTHQDVKQGTDTWAVMNQMASITPMLAKYHCVEYGLENEFARVFPDLHAAKTTPTSRQLGNSARIEGQKHILIGATGSVASIKVPILVEKLKRIFDDKVQIRVVATQYAQHFFKKEDAGCEVFTDENEWESWKKVSDPVLHIELRNWADIMVVAPLDANTLGKLANGACDNLLTSVLRAWDPERPVVLCPAMNTFMWNHPFTAKHLQHLEGVLRYRIVPPISKTLACGDVGIGAMAEPRDIATYVQHVLLTDNN
ncbi:hypothetical protein HK097_001755 [Rhizophlyctis rosea]|uniref:Flavoprotein domain-containing protein n=1 Tax=Rhizophlyctis rosea TaxID=64517 RepID=A0AAD5SHB0_9FUNG|nr:hypothetical protein HK097_001755 [Rhizophlyctis rosea]